MNDIYNKLYELQYFNSLYLKRYIKLINYYKNIQNEIIEKYEIHHILPKSLFPEYKNTKENLIKLPYRVHYLAHFMLAKIFHDKMIYAFNSMCNKNTKNGRLKKINSSLYKTNKKNFSKEHKEWHKQESSIKGLTNSDYIGMKTKETKISISEDYYTEISKKSAKTMKETIEENGLTIAQNRAINVAEKIKQNGSLKGAKSSNAKVIRIFDSNDILIYEFFGDFFQKCKELKLPERALKFSYLNNSEPLYQSKFGKSTAKRLGFEKYIGWRAEMVGRTRNFI